MLYMYKLEIVFPHTRPHVWPTFCLCLSSLTTLGCSRWAVVSQVQLGYCSRIAGPWSWRRRWRYQMYICWDRRVYSYETCILCILTDVIHCISRFRMLCHILIHYPCILFMYLRSDYYMLFLRLWILWYFNLFYFYLYFTPKAPVFRRTRGSDVS